MPSCILKNATGAFVARPICRHLLMGAIAINVLFLSASAQTGPHTSRQIAAPNAAANAEQIAKILGISQHVAETRGLQNKTSCGSTPTIEELMVRQQVLETV